MANESGTGFCYVCQERTRVERKGINHVLHLLLTLVTFGLWIFVWLLTPLLRQPWHCTRCGSLDVETRGWKLLQIDKQRGLR
jgi:hypothetical protein